MSDYQVIILAAGHGKRMKSELPKVMHKVAGKPMIERVLDNVQNVTDDIILVQSQLLASYDIKNRDLSKIVIQDVPLGTAHAIYCAIDLIDHEKDVAVIYADNPFIAPGIIKEMFNHLQSVDAAVTTLSFYCKVPNQYGRIITDKDGNFLKIVEFKYATEAEKKVELCNSGIMAFRSGVLQKYLQCCLEDASVDTVEHNVELYITNIIEVCVQRGEKVSHFLLSSDNIGVGVNTMEELAIANDLMNKLAN